MQKRESKETQSTLNLKELCRLIQNGRFGEILELIAGAKGPEKSEELEKEPLYRSALYWKGQMDTAAAMERYAESEFLIARWDEFKDSPEAAALSERVFYALKEYVFKKALQGYLELYNLSGIDDTAALTRMGQLYHGLGDYERAIQSYELAHKRAKDDPRIMARLADCYGLAGETKAAKLLFREAFFLDPGACDPESCESGFIRELLTRLRAEGIPAEDGAWWLPVYAALLGVFNVKRELKPVEIGRLTQSIRELEAEGPGGLSGRDKARLLNRYFWLADHYTGLKAPKEDLDEVLGKIEALDANIYERYIH
jgi:tetratricopeptide (TPR) repeat protein